MAIVTTFDDLMDCPVVKVSQPASIYLEKLQVSVLSQPLVDGKFLLVKHLKSFWLDYPILMATLERLLGSDLKNVTYVVIQNERLYLIT